MNICLGELCVRRCVDASVSSRFLGQPHLRLVIDSEVRQLCLYTDGNLLSDVSHLQGLLSQVPLVPAVVRFDVLLYEMRGRFHALVDHKRGGNRKQRVHTVLALKQSCQRGLREVILHLEQVDQLRLPATPLNHFIQVLLWLLDELVNAHLVCKYTILLGVLEDT